VAPTVGGRTPEQMIAQMVPGKEQKCKRLFAQTADPGRMVSAFIPT
jgi:hypothetical protein